MAKYDVTWTGLGSQNREGIWQPLKWIGALSIIAEHEGESHTDRTSSLYDQLEERFPDDTWRNEDPTRSLFRAYQSVWTLTGLATFDGSISITPLGRRLLAGEIKPAEVIKMALLRHEENGERPFAILAEAFLEANRELSFEELYHGVMRNYRPGQDNLEQALSQMERSPIADTPKRRLQLMLTMLERVGGITKTSEWQGIPRKWEPWDRHVLHELAARARPMGPVTALEVLHGLLPEYSAALADSSLVFDNKFLARFCAALLAKPFVILTGLSGSGKTQLALSFAKWIADPNHEGRQFEVIAVGADWTSNEQVLGYADALDKSRYVRTKALDLILKAAENPQLPYFLILDEMNLSHVERYFSDILSAIESLEPIYLHSDGQERAGVPPTVLLPSNLFIVGTVNVDETTYMFSPKVLDRANTIEFRVSSDQLKNFINHLDQTPSSLEWRGSAFGEAFVSAAKTPAELDGPTKERLESEVMLFFDALQLYGAEFAFRTTKEIFSFVAYYLHLVGADERAFIDALDAQVLQKLLPRLNGSRSKLEPILWSMSALCAMQRQWNNGQITNRDEIINQAKKAASRGDENLHPANWKANGEYLSLSCEKIERMQHLLEQNGFASFAEA